MVLLRVGILSGALLANGVPHFVHGVSGAPFQSPFVKPPEVGGVFGGGAGALAISIQLALHFGKVRAGKP